MWLARLVLAAVVATIGLSATERADAGSGNDGGAGSISSPVVVPDTYEIQPEQVVEVSFAGFASRTVTVSLCGNVAIRGSADCNLAASESSRTNPDRSPRLVQLTASPPPVPCPCLIRVASPTNDEVATVAVTLVGHPTAEPVGGQQPREPLVASLRAEPAGNGLGPWFRAALGGPRAYEVTITIGNTSSVAASQVAARAFVGRRPGHVRTAIEVPVPGRIGAGETWDYVTVVEVPAPTWGDAYWQLDVTGSRPTVVATDATSHRPVLLVALLGLLVVDVVVLVARVATRRIRRARQRKGGNSPPLDGPLTVIGDAPGEPAGSRELELVR
jgi:hypothetical protein